MLANSHSIFGGSRQLMNIFNQVKLDLAETNSNIFVQRGQDIINCLHQPI